LYGILVEDADYLAATFPFATPATKATKGKAGKKQSKPSVARGHYVEAAVLMQKASMALDFPLLPGTPWDRYCSKREVWKACLSVWLALIVECSQIAGGYEAASSVHFLSGHFPATTSGMLRRK
jgi:hypothetical protein